MSYGKAANSFMDWAKKNDLKFYNGLGMLLEQAADSFYMGAKKAFDFRRTKKYIK